MRLLLTFIFAAAMPIAAFAANDQQKLDGRLDAAQHVLQQIMSVPDKAIPNGIARRAVCVAVVPSMVKGAFVVGAEYGQGVVTCRTATGWSAPVFIRLAGGSVGFQIGGQGTDLVLVALNQNGFQELLKDKFKIGGDASAAAGPVGRDAQASTDLLMKDELLTWSRSRGIFAGVDLNGMTVSKNADDTDAFYGAPHPFRQLLRGQVAPPEAADPFLHSVAEYFGAAEAAHR